MVINIYTHPLTSNYMFTTGHSNYKEKKKQTFILLFHSDPQA